MIRILSIITITLILNGCTNTSNNYRYSIQEQPQISKVEQQKLNFIDTLSKDLDSLKTFEKEKESDTTIYIFHYISKD